MGSKLSTDCDCTNDNSATTPTHSEKPRSHTTATGDSTSTTQHQHNLSEESPLHIATPRTPPTSSQGRRKSRGRNRVSTFSIPRLYHIFVEKMTMNTRSGYFRNYTNSKGLLYGIAISYVLGCSLVSICEPFLIDCKQEAVLSNFENPGYAFTQGN